MALVIYGSARSRTLRTLWLAAELGLDYEHVPLEWDDPFLKSAEFLRLNPAGAIPTIVDDGFALGESMAIHLYLAKKYDIVGEAHIYPREPALEAEVWRWSLWAQAHLEPWLQRDVRLAELRKATQGPATAFVEESLTVLNRALGDHDCLVGPRFTVADLNVAGVLSPSRGAHLDLGGFPGVAAWLARCYGRPAARETRRRFG